MLIIDSVTKKFGDKIILNNFDLEVKTGSVALLLGSSGVGKSTLLRVLVGLEKADSGSILLDNKKVDMNNINKNHQFGMVFQNFNLFSNFSTLGNISFPLQQIKNLSKNEADRQAQDLLTKYQLQDKTYSSVDRLSGGQKQRLAIARTIALKPRIICMDEPTSSLDPLLTSHIARTIEELAHEGFSVIVATHDTFLIEKIPCALHLMQSGTIVESATSSLYWKKPENFPLLDTFVKGHGQNAI